MQIPPAGWTNPAAATQQSLSAQRGESSRGESVVSHSINHVENSEKTGDRDADERYDGPQSHSQGQSPSENSQDQVEQRQPSMTDLPADDGQPSQLDLRG